jgi:chemotaxis protein CheD
VGGITHYLLPETTAQSEPSPRFGNVAVSVLIEKIYAMGGKVPRLQAKVFGGACVLESLKGHGADVGRKNIHIAHQLLSNMSIPVVTEDVGGKRGRKLFFFTDNGSAWVRKI